jgi:hypothetical protein
MILVALKLVCVGGAAMVALLRPALMSLILLTLITGVAYPLR